MKEFAETLRAIDSRLDLPQPARSRVLLEIASDLRDMYEYYRRQGLSAQDARREAVEHCDLSEEVLAELTQLHTSPWRRFMDRFSEQAQTRWERALTVLMLAFIAVVVGRVIATADVFTTAPRWWWAAVAVTSAAAALAGIKLYLAFIKQDHDSRRLRVGLSWLLVAAGADLLIGAYGNWMGMYGAARRTAGDLEGLWRYVVEWLLGGAGLQIICFTGAIACALLWYVIANKVARIERAEAAALLGRS
jgi:hypothetical protein